MAARRAALKSKRLSQTERLREDALGLARLVRAFEALTTFDTKTARLSARRFRQRQQQIENSTKSELRELIGEWREVGRIYRERYRPRVPDSELFRRLDDIESAPKGIAWIKKSDVTRLFDCDHWFPRLGVLPGHANLAINPIDVENVPGGSSETRVVETTLFEDACALFNQVCYCEAERKKITAPPKTIVKTSMALNHATIVAALNFVEAYLNGLAADHFADNEGTLDQETKDVLADWDSARRRPKYLSLRDKALQYPRTILGLEHPPLQENNCPELAFVTSTARNIRDAIVHPSAVPDKGPFNPRENLLYSITFGDVEKVVDSAVALVRKIRGVIYPDGPVLIDWLQDRGEDGMFDESVFS